MYYNDNKSRQTIVRNHYINVLYTHRVRLLGLDMIRCLVWSLCGRQLSRGTNLGGIQYHRRVTLLLTLLRFDRFSVDDMNIFMRLLCGRTMYTYQDTAIL